MAIKSKLREYESISIFLIMELVALTSFCLGGTSTVFHYVGFVVSLIAFLFAYNNYDKREYKSLLIILIPLFIFAATISFGNLYGGFSNPNTILANLGSFFGILGFFFTGLSARRTKNLKVENVLLCLGFGAALLVLISLFITWVQYGFFYTLIYRNTPAYYYNGSLYNVTKEMAWLNGFAINEVSLYYSGLFGVLLCCALPALFFIDPKKDLKKFIMVGSIGLVGFLSIITLVNIAGLIFLIPVIATALIYRFLRENKKFWKIATFAFEVLLGFIAVALVFAFLNALVPAVHSFTSGNAALNRLFNGNRIMDPFNQVVGVMFKSYNLFGFPLYSAADAGGTNYNIIFNNGHIFELEIIKEGGVFALISFIAFIVISIFSLSRYLKRSKDSHPIKISMLCFVVGFIFYSSFAWDNMPFTHLGEFQSFGKSFPLMILLFILGLTFFPRMKEEPLFNDFDNKANKKEDKKVEYIDKDYVFTDVDEDEDDGKDNLVV